MVTAKFIGNKGCISQQVFQWDYGQELAIENSEIDIPDGTEAQFYQGDLSHRAYISSGHVPIPDIMLQSSADITVYLYVTSRTSGETVLSIVIPVIERPQPEDYILPEYKEYQRLIPRGGDLGQVLRTASNEDYDTEWNDPMPADMEEMTDEEIDAMFMEDQMT